MSSMTDMPDRVLGREVPPPLSPFRILEFGDRLTAYCGKVLADLGADVIQIEPPSGSGMRLSPPFRDGELTKESSLFFAYYQHNKRGITLDWSSDNARSILEELARGADVVLHSPDARHPLIGLLEGRQRSLLLHHAVRLDRAPAQLARHPVHVIRDERSDASSGAAGRPTHRPARPAALR